MYRITRTPSTTMVLGRRHVASASKARRAARRLKTPTQIVAAAPQFLAPWQRALRRVATQKGPQPGLPRRQRGSQSPHAQYVRSMRKMMLHEREAGETSYRERLNACTVDELAEQGLALVDVYSRHLGDHFSKDRIGLSYADRSNLSEHRFRVGDFCTVSVGSPLEGETVQASVLGVFPTQIDVTVHSRNWNFKHSGPFRVDFAPYTGPLFSKIQDRLDQMERVDRLSSDVLRAIVSGSFDSLRDASTVIPPDCIKLVDDFPGYQNLNDSQKSAFRAALTAKLTLIQGPPGTGKTATTVELLRFIAEHAPPDTKILATASSNVAVDNILKGLLKRGDVALRAGGMVRADPSVYHTTTEFLARQHPFFPETKFQRTANRQEFNQRKAMVWEVIFRDIGTRSKIVCSTCSGIPEWVEEFSVVVVDEASQMVEGEALLALTKGARHVVMVGDHKQLPPTVLSDEGVTGGLGESLFERLLAQGYPVQLLATQYRMHPYIADFSSKTFYNGELLNDISTRRRRVTHPLLTHPVTFLNVEGEEASLHSSKQNLTEAQAVAHIVRDLVEHRGVHPDAQWPSMADIGIVTPYAAQVGLIEKELLSAMQGSESTARMAQLEEVAAAEEIAGKVGLTEIKSVDGFQGSEKDIIIISTVRSNPHGNLGFVSDARRMNVAITRAKHFLIIVGNMQTLTYGPLWSQFMLDVEEKGAFLSHWHGDESTSPPVADPLGWNGVLEDWTKEHGMEADKGEGGSPDVLPFADILEGTEFNAMGWGDTVLASLADHEEQSIDEPLETDDVVDVKKWSGAQQRTDP